MDERFNKPRVFLSHSKKNSDFIERLASDLQKCQIEPWLDTDQIRHGKSWQDSIFELGLPTCDAILVYFTELSIQSAVVKKEMDVGLLQNLKDSNVAFLPYVSNEKLRSELRPDIQALQTPEWNDENYQLLLPRVVAEIWRSYLERIVISVTKGERLKRIEAELELSKYKNQPESVFSLSENKEFEYIWNSFDRMYPFFATTYVYDANNDHMVEIIAYRFQLQLSTIFSLINQLFSLEYERGKLTDALSRLAVKVANIDLEDDSNIRFKYEEKPSILDELLTNGLVKNITFTSRSEDREYLDLVYQLTDKYFRFRFWLAFNKKLPEKILLNVVK